MKINPVKAVRGEVKLPGDKSISHRYAILGAVSRGKTVITNYSNSADCRSTLDCLRQLGVALHQEAGEVRIEGRGWEGLRAPTEALDAGNSGTTLRLLAGVLAAQPFRSVLQGDPSLNRRPMRRIIDPLTLMGAAIDGREGQFPPLTISGSALHGIRYELPVASAQVKSCVLLAGLTAQGSTAVIEKIPSRDHTERALPVFGAEIRREGLESSVAGGQRLKGAFVPVPGDFSSAAYFIASALLLPGSDIRLPAVGVNPTRTGFLAFLDAARVAVEMSNRRMDAGEPVADLRIVYHPGLAEKLPSEIGGRQLPGLIDEIPVLCVLAAGLGSGFILREAEELRKKESDRLDAVAGNLDSLGVRVFQTRDGLHIPPGQEIRGGQVKTFGDHRIAMAFSIAGLIAREPVELDDPDCTAVSFPGFFDQLAAVSVR